MGCIYSLGKVLFGVGIIDVINMYYGKLSIFIGVDYDECFGDLIDKMDVGKLVWDIVGFGYDIIFNCDVLE